MIKYFQIRSKEELRGLKGLTAKYKNLNFSFPSKYISKMENILNSKNGYQLFAKNNEQIVGYVAGAETIHPRYFTMSELFVDPSAQRKGVGSKLTDMVIKYAEKKKLNGVITQTEFENIPAQKLYEKIGFVKVDNPEWKDGITYELRFEPHKK